MEVSRSGYYRFLKNRHTKEVEKDFTLLAQVRHIHQKSRRTYGSRRMAISLQAAGYAVGRYKARSLMKKAGLKVRPHKRFKRTTDSRHSLPVAPNLLKQRFQVDGPNRIWCGDITYLWTLEGWLYLAVIIDLYSRKVIGWAIDAQMKTSLVLEALRMAYWRRKPAQGLIHHSDQGSQYAAYDYQQQLNIFGMIPSMSGKGNGYDNAVVESFFHTLKKEQVGDQTYPTREEARREVIDYIEMFYNSQRLHSSLGYLSPNNFERDSLLKKLLNQVSIFT
jgi:transposase InsO family protein